jgi:hypothetical protein
LRTTEDKDALDVLRLLRGTDTEALAKRMRRLLANDQSRATTEQALEIVVRFFGQRRAEGTSMAIRATERVADPGEIARSCELLSKDL